MEESRRWVKTVESKVGKSEQECLEDVLRSC